MNLIDYLPPYYKEIRESKALNLGLTQETISLWDEVKTAYDNQYAKTCDNVTLYKWEKLLDGLYGTTWEEKRKTLILLFNSKGNINENWVIESLLGFISEEEFFVLVDRTNYILRVMIKHKYLQFVDSIYRHLRKNIPANLVLIVSEYLKTWGTAKQAGSWEYAKVSTWEDLYRYKYTND